jgi:hypothetical protein
MDNIITEVKNEVSTWKHEADKIGITKKEQIIMAKAFNV